MTDIGELVIRIKADAAQLERELKKANTITQQETRKMGGAFATLATQAKQLIPAVTIASVVLFGKRALEASDHINDLSKQIDFAATTLSALEIPLVQTGLGLDGFVSSVSILNSQIGEAIKGNQQARDTFAQLGIGIEQLLQMNAEQRFFAVAKALAQIEDSAVRAEAGRALLGRGFAKLNPLLQETSGNLAEVVDKAKQTIDAISPEAIARVDQFGDALAAAGIKARNAFVEAFAAILRVLDAAESVSSGRLSQARLGNVPTNEQFGPPIPRGSVSTNVRGTIVSLEKFGPNPEKKRTQAIVETNKALKEQTKIVKEELPQALDTFEDKSLQTVRVFKSSFEDAIESVTFDFKNFGSAASSILNAVARDLFRSTIAQPLSGMATGFIGSLFGGNSASQAAGFATTGGYGPFPGFAEGGRNPVGSPYWVGENGPELRIDGPGTIIPNKAIGGTSVTVIQNNHFASGVTRSEVASLLPQMVAESKAAVFEAMRRGGSEARIAGLRN